jgi:hypothetical protein
MLDALYPLADHLPELKGDNRKDASFADTRRRLAAMIESYREAWTHRGTERLIESEVFEEPTSAADMARGAPYMLLNLAAQVLPGWMGRGYVWPTQLFEKIGVGVSHVFEKPTALFEPLVRAFPEIEEGFSTTIFQNYSLGGYVRPANVAVLKALLEKHRRELILAWIEPEQAADADLDELSADYRKILEPVTLAERQGHGFIEAAEIYSGFMGVMN